MQIDETGFVKATLYNYLEYMTADIQENGTFGSNFTIKKEGVVDAILSSVSKVCLSIEDKIAFALKQINPYTAEGEWQDRLYALVGLSRERAKYTVVTRTISANANTTIGINELVFRTVQGDQFYLNTAVTTDSEGKVVGSFTAYESGAIDCEGDLTVTSSPINANVIGVYSESGSTTTIGRDYESDSEFRAKWIATNSVMATSRTEGGLRTALLPLVENPKDLKIRQNRGTQTYLDLALHTINVVLKSAESDNTIAKRILEYYPDGVGIAGTTTVTLQDSEGTNVDIKFTRASNIDISFKVEVVLNNGYSLADVINKIKSAIVDNFNYFLGERIIANDFYAYINAIEGIDYVTLLKVSLGGSNPTWLETLPLDYDEYGTVISDHITVTESA